MSELRADGLVWGETCDVTPAACEVVEDVNDDLRRDLVLCVRCGARGAGSAPPVGVC